jgi:hypothetical protein
VKFTGNFFKICQLIGCKSFAICLQGNILNDLVCNKLNVCFLCFQTVVALFDFDANDEQDLSLFQVSDGIMF